MDGRWLSINIGLKVNGFMTKIMQEMDGNSGGMLVLLGISRTMEYHKIPMVGDLCVKKCKGIH